MKNVLLIICLISAFVLGSCVESKPKQEKIEKKTEVETEVPESEEIDSLTQKMDEMTDEVK